MSLLQGTRDIPADLFSGTEYTARSMPVPEKRFRLPLPLGLVPFQHCLSRVGCVCRPVRLEILGAARPPSDSCTAHHKWGYLSRPTAFQQPSPIDMLFSKNFLPLLLSNLAVTIMQAVTACSTFPWLMKRVKVFNDR